MKQLATPKVLWGLAVLNLVLIIVVLALSFALLNRSQFSGPRFEATKSPRFWIMFDTKTAQLCNAFNPDGVPNVSSSKTDISDLPSPPSTPKAGTPGTASPNPLRSIKFPNAFNQLGRRKWDNQGLAYCKDLK